MSVIAGFLLSRAAPFVEGDIAAVRAESLARVTDAATEPEGVENP